MHEMPNLQRTIQINGLKKSRTLTNVAEKMDIAEEEKKINSHISVAINSEENSDSKLLFKSNTMKDKFNKRITIDVIDADFESD